MCNGAADLALSQKLAEELQFEKETSAQGEDVLVPAFLQAFKNAGTWAVCFSPFDLLRSYVLSLHHTHFV